MNLVRSRGLRAALIATALVALPLAAHANCGAENCPLNPQGLESAGRAWSLDIGYQYIGQDRRWDGTHETAAFAPAGHVTELLTRTRSWSVNARAQLVPALRITATLPYIQREHEHEYSLEHHPNFIVPLTSRWKYEGLGDATVLGQWTALGSERARMGALMVQAGAKLPTGRTRVPEATPTGNYLSSVITGEPEAPEPPARPGSGSTDFLAGLQLVRQWRVAAPRGLHTTLPLVVSVQGRYNGKGTDDYRSGNELHTSVSTAYAVLRGASLLAQVNVIVHGRDDVGDTDAAPHHTGGTSVFATPGLRLALPAASALYGYWQARVYEHTNGPQLVAPSHLILGVSLGFGS
jgi:hypothetical protein